MPLASPQPRSDQPAGEDARGKSDAVSRKFNGVSYAGRFNYEIDIRFSGEYQGAIDGYSSGTTEERVGVPEGGPWRGRSVRESIAAATGRLPVNASESRAELSGGNGSEEAARITPADHAATDVDMTETVN